MRELDKMRHSELLEHLASLFYRQWEQKTKYTVKENKTKEYLTKEVGTMVSTVTIYCPKSLWK